MKISSRKNRNEVETWLFVEIVGGGTSDDIFLFLLSNGKQSFFFGCSKKIRITLHRNGNDD
jgi:hypothetical protein